MSRLILVLCMVGCLCFSLGCFGGESNPDDPPILERILANGTVPTGTLRLSPGETVDFEADVNTDSYSLFTYQWTQSSAGGSILPGTSQETVLTAGTTPGTYEVVLRVDCREIDLPIPRTVSETVAFQVIGPLEPGDNIQGVRIGTTDCTKGGVHTFTGGQTLPVTITPKGTVHDVEVEYTAQTGTVTPTGTYTANWVVPATPGLFSFFVTMTAAPTPGGTPTESEYSFLVSVTAP